MNSTQNKTSRSILMIVISGVIALGLLIAGLTRKEFGYQFVSKGSYYIVLIMVAFWLFQTFSFFKSGLKKNYKSLLICLILTTAVFVSVPPKYRVLSDETNLLSVSQSMTYKKEIFNVTQAKFFFGNLNPVQADLPTRPLLFPFLTHVVHTVAGYRYQNVFVLNFLILFALLSLIFITVDSKMGKTVAMAACLLAISIPTLTLSATSGGFDVCSLLFFSLSFVLLYHFLEFPSSERFAMLFIQLMLLAQIRYESIAYVALILGTLFVMRKIKFQMITENSLLFSFAPFFLLPMLLQRKLTPNTFENPPGVPPFAVSHFIEHAKVMGKAMVFASPEYPYPTYLNWLAVVLLAFMVIKLAPRAKEVLNSSQRIIAFLILGTVGMSLLIVLSHHFGIYPHPTQARLFLVFLMFLAMMPVVFRYFYPDFLSEKKLLGIALFSVILYHPVAVEGRFTNSLTLIRETEDIYHFLETIQDPKILIVAERPGQLTVANYGAVGFGFANGNKQSLLDDLNRGVFSNIWIFQKYDYETGLPIGDCKLDPEFTLEPVKDFMITAQDFIRISKVKHSLYPVQPAKPQAKSDLKPEFQNILKNVEFK